VIVIVIIIRFTSFYNNFRRNIFERRSVEQESTCDDKWQHETALCCVVFNVFLILCETSGGLASGCNNNNNSTVGNRYTGFIHFASGITNTACGGQFIVFTL